MDQFDKWLDEQLRKPGTYIADEGFSKSVVNRLPPKRPLRAFDRKIALSCAGVFGGVLTFALATPVEALLGLAGYSSLFETLFLSSVLFTAMLTLPLLWAARSR